MQIETFEYKPILISNQGGCRVYRLGEDQIAKSGTRVRPSELEAINLVYSFTPLALPKPIYAEFEHDKELGISSI